MTTEQIDKAVDWLLRAAPVADRLLKTAVICAALYVLLEVGVACVPGGPVQAMIYGH